MCGIVGFIKIEKSKKIDKKEMLNTILHRGPDEQNFYEDENVVLGHTRLSIVDIKDGHQPYLFKNLVIVFNGEIYNYKEIRKDLEFNGYSFDTNSDTEVLLKAYHCYGNDFIDKLNGMYAFVIYNKDDNSFVISRDFFGIKPLYIFYKENEFYFASEIVALVHILKMNDTGFNINIKAQKEYLEKGFISENSIIDNVYEIEKGNLYKLKRDELIVQKKIDFSMDINDNLENLLLKELEEEFSADVEVGIMLSGGIDSSILTALSSKINNNLTTFSIAFEDKELYDESKYAQIVANKFNTNHKEFLFKENVLLEYLPQLIETIDIPIYDPAMLPMLFLSENISNYCKVVISGDGGDELFAGYTHHKVLKYRKLFLYISKVLDILGILQKKNLTLKNLLAYANDFEESLSFDQEIGLNKRLLRKTDLCSMRYGVEVRVPFLSKRIYNYSAIKDKKKFINIFYGKLPLRKLANRLINREVAYKKKQGFRVPIREWVVNGELGKMIEVDLKDNLLIDSRVIQESQIKLYVSNKEQYYKELFSLYLLNNWLKKGGNLI